MPTAEKESIVQDLAGQFRGAKSVLFADYRGLDVEAMTELRKRCREASVNFRIAKNTLTRLALAEAGLPQGETELLKGPTGLALSLEDELAAAKVLTDFAKAFEKLQIKGGLMEGQIVGSDDVKALATLPTKDELIAMLLADMESSLSQVIGVGDSLVRDILSCAEQVAEKAGGEAPSAEPAAAAAGASESAGEAAPAEAAAEAAGDAPEASAEASSE
jgi:large subunit ribosomal protein L10